MAWIKGKHPDIAEHWEDKDKNPEYWWNIHASRKICSICAMDHQGDFIDYFDYALSYSDKCWKHLADDEVVEYLKLIRDDIINKENGCRGLNLYVVNFSLLNNVPLPIDDNYTRSHLINKIFDAALLDYADFSNLSLYGSSFVASHLHLVSFAASNIYEVNFNCAFLFGMLLRLKDMDFGTCKISNLKRVGEEIIGNYDFAYVVYLEIKTNLKSHGHYELAEAFYYREMKCRRKTKLQTLDKTMQLNVENKIRNFKDILFVFTNIIEYVFYDLTCGYGTKIGRLLFSSSLVIMFCGIVYIINAPLILDKYNNIITIDGSFYLSLLSFTTMGTGPYILTDWIRFIAPLESALGILTFAVLIYCFGRKISN